MKQLLIILSLCLLNLTTKAQNIPFVVSEASTFKSLILNGNNPCTTNFSAVYAIDEKNSDWKGMSAKEKIQFINNTSLLIEHGSEYTVCKMVIVNKKLTTYTENISGESILTYTGDTTSYKCAFTLASANPAGQDLKSEPCNLPKYDYEGFNCFCNRFVSKNISHPKECMVTDNFPAVNTIFNLYYGFDKATYFPVNYYITVDGHSIALSLKKIYFEQISEAPMPHMEDFANYQELNFAEFFLKTTELR